jgi:predicted transcriptional regulator
LQRVARELDMRLDQLDGAAEKRLVERLAEIAEEPRLARHAPEADAIAELIGRYPGWAAALAALGRSEREATELAQALSDRLTHDPFLGESIHAMLTNVAAIRSSAEILVSFPDIEPERRARFEQAIYEESQRLSDVAEALTGYFDKAHTAARAVTPFDEVEALFEAQANRFPEIEAAAAGLSAKIASSETEEGRRESAEKLVRRDLSGAIRRIIEDSEQVVTERAAARARMDLEYYALDAALAPEAEFFAAAEEARYDVEEIARRLRIPIETAFRRLSTLPRDADSPRFGYLCVNAAGHPLVRREIEGLTMPRAGGACPLWNVFRAQGRPDEATRQLVDLPSGDRFVFVARTRQVGQAKFGQPRNWVSDMLAMTEADAKRTVYGDRLSGETAEPVGFACRICPREACEQRVIDRLTGG